MKEEEMINLPGTSLNTSIFVLMAKSHSSSDNEGAGGRALSGHGRNHITATFSTRGNEMTRLSLQLEASPAQLPRSVLMF